MTGKEILLKALKCEETPRVPWLPFVGVHGGQLIQKTADEYLKSADLIYEGIKKSAQAYKADGVPVVFDLQMEAEILGCDLEWAKEGPPAVKTHPLSEDEGGTLADLPEFDLNNGRFPLVLEATRKLKADIGDEVALYGLICGPFTLALHLIGNDIFLDMFDDEDKVKEIIDFCAEVGKKASEAYIEAGCDVIAIVDPMTSQISPEHFTEFVTPYVNKIFDYVHEKGALGSMFVCGDATRNLENMCKTTCDNVSIDENISLELLREFAEKHGKSYGGNLKLTVVLLLGTEQDSKIDTLRCLDAAEGSKGFVLAPGCDLSYAVPQKNLEAVAELVHDEYKREVARQIVAAPSSETFDDIVVPEYAKEDKVIIDLITLDSATCAPCQYMTEAANLAAGNFGGKVVVREHKVTNRDGLGYMTKLGVANIPTICIEGEAKFISIIPDQPTLVKAIEEKVSAKCGASK